MRLAELIEGRLVRRYKRFFADVELAGGEVVVAHCPNPGSMKGCAPDGGRVWLSESDKPGRKLRYTWELVENDGAMICVHTGHANHVVAEALDRGVVAELVGWPTVKREVKYGEKSRIDVLLLRGDERCYVEVKSVTLGRGDGVSAFPDSVTARGTRHLAELEAMVAEGHRAVMLFCAARSDTRMVEPADDIDPTYGAALRHAAAAGVELLAYRCQVDPQQVTLVERVPLRL